MGYLSVVITIGGYLLYLMSMYKEELNVSKQIAPHPLSWVLFGFLTGTGWLIQVARGAQAGSWTLGVTAAFCFLIAGLSYLKYKQQFKWNEWAWVVLGLFLFLFYFLTNAATLSAIFITLADLAGYGPTVQKGWKQPWTDNPVNFLFNSVKCGPALLALSSYSWATSVYLWMLLTMNALVALLLLWRRDYLARK
jgi:hypothetical protein